MRAMSESIHVTWDGVLQPVEPSKPSTRSGDEMAIRALYTQLMEGWNSNSGEAFAAPFAEQCDLVAFDGTHFVTRHEIATFQQALFNKWLKGTCLVGEVKQVRFLSDDVAVMHAIGGTLMRNETKPLPTRDSIQTLVIRRTPDGWRIEAFQNTRLRMMERSFAAVLLWNFTDWLWSFALRRR
jgi:uncharacterized protein (TIGR02246 family)